MTSGVKSNGDGTMKSKDITDGLLDLCTELVPFHMGHVVIDMQINTYDTQDNSWF